MSPIAALWQRAWLDVSLLANKQLGQEMRRRWAGRAIGAGLAALLVALVWVAAARGDPAAVPVVVWVLLVHAYARGVQLVAADKLLDSVRTRFAHWAGFTEDEELTALAYLAGCPWCLSVWVAAVLSCVVLAAPSGLAVMLVLTLAGSELAVIFDRLVDRVTPDPPEEYTPPAPSGVVSALYSMTDEDQI